MELFGCGFNGFGQLLPQTSKRCLISPVKIFPVTEHVECQIESQVDGKFATSWCAVYVISDSKILQQGFYNGKKTKFQALKTSDELHASVRDVDTSGEKLYYTKTDGECVVVDTGTGQELKVKGQESAVIPRFSQVAAGDTYAVAVTDESSAGLISSENRGYVFRPFDCTIRFSQISCGKEHVILLSCFHQVYSYGLGSRGQLGNGTTDGERQPRLLEALASVPVGGVSAGGWHSAAVSTIGDLYVWGWNESGQLGLPMQRNPPSQQGSVSRDKPEESHGQPSLEKLHTGVKRTFQGAAAAQDTTTTKKASLESAQTGNLLAQWLKDGNYADNVITGEDRATGPTADGKQLHLGISVPWTEVYNQEEKNIVKTPLVLEKGSQGHDGKEATSTSFDETAVQIHLRDGSSRIAHEATDVIDEQGGSGGDAVLFQALPSLLDLPDGKDVSKVSCGSRHTAAVSADGRLYTWGWGAYGQLGHGDTRTLDTPTRVKCFRDDQRVRDVSCGAWSTLVSIIHQH